MSYSKERDEFIAIATQEGLSVETARKLLRYATTLHRLAEAQCNGDWPADNGERKVIFCTRCEGGFVRSVFKRAQEHREEEWKDIPKGYHVQICPDCRTAELVRVSLPEGYKAIINGDPRGAVLKITVPSGRTNDCGREGICVPSRG